MKCPNCSNNLIVKELNGKKYALCANCKQAYDLKCPSCNNNLIVKKLSSKNYALCKNCNKIYDFNKLFVFKNGHNIQKERNTQSDNNRESKKDISILTTKRKNIPQHFGIHRIPSNSVDFDTLDGYAFEQFCANLLKNNGFTDVEVTPKRSDHGIDILATNGNKHYAIQCKRYSKNVGNKAIQEVYSGKDISKSDIAVVITNRYFTKQAIHDARKLEVQLWDRNKLLQLIRSEKIEDIPQHHQLENTFDSISKKGVTTNISNRKTFNEYLDEIIAYQEKTHDTSPKVWKICGAIMKFLAVFTALIFGSIGIFGGIFILLPFTIFFDYILYKLGTSWINQGKKKELETVKSKSKII